MNRQDFAHQAKGRQDHDVNGGVGIEPEQMLVDHHIAPQGGIEETCMGNDVETQQHQRSSKNRC